MVALMKEKLNVAAICMAAIGFLCSVFPQSKVLAQACPGLGSITLTVVAAPVPTLTAPPQLCPGANGTVAVNQTFSTYAWNTGGTEQSIAITNPGTYTVTVSNAAGCTGTATANVAPAQAPAPNITQNTYACNGQITLNAGAGFTTYAWSDGGGSGQTATYTTAGNYTVTVTNAQGCTGTDDFTVNIPVPPVVAISGNLNICTGQSTVLSATAGFTTYAWSGGGNTANLNVIAGGAYTVTATDAFGCTDTESATVVANQSPAPIVANADICPGASVTLSVSNAPFQSYAWSNGGNQSTATVNAPGTYTVTVTAANGCSGTTSANVAPLPAPGPNITQNTYACNGQITLNAGAGFTTYAWSDGGGSGQTATYTTAGNYTVTVTNAQGCTGTDDFTVNIPVPPVVAISGNLNICTGQSTVLSATAGFTTYAWSGGGNTANLNVIAGGAYTVTATDAFGCTDTESATVVANQSPAPTVANANICPGASVTLSVSNAPFQTYAWSNGGNQSTTTVNAPGAYTVTVTAANGCTGTTTSNVASLPAPAPNITQNTYACNGQITLNAGAGFTTYAWSDGGGGQTATYATAGNYTVTVTNAAGCTGTDDFTVTIPVPPVVAITGDASFCDGAAADLSASPGSVSYAWSNSQSGPNISVTNPGTFTVTATDNFGCTATDNFTVTELPTPQPVVTGPNTVCAGATATFSTTAPFAAYAWSTGSNQPSITVQQSATYTVTVTAANGCTGTDTQALSLLPTPNPNISAAPYACDDELTLNAGPGFVAYVWAGPNGQTGNSQQQTVSISGNYTVTVTAANGCTGTDTYFADIPVPPSVDITGSSAICPGSSSTLSATLGFSNYLWSTNSNSPNISVATAGNYTVTVTDAFGCTATDGFSVNALAAPAPNISGPAQICASGSATYSAPGAFTAFAWSTGANTPTITVNQAATYTVTVTAANGCTGADTQTLTVANSLQPQITELPYACDGQITLDAGAGFSTYAWAGPNGQTANSQQLTASSPGQYTVTVSDVTGCTGAATTATSIPAAPKVAVTGNNIICAGADTPLSATAGLTAYLWSTNQVGASISVSAAGVYTVTATDALGCTATDDFLLTNTPAPQPQIVGPTALCTNSTVTLDAGAGYAAYAWAGPNGQTANNPTLSANSPGAYTVTVTDATGCTGTDSQAVTEATSIPPNLTQLPYTCTGAQTLDAGAGFTTYTWAGPNGQTANSQQLNANSPGTYAVTVTSGVGCTGTGTLAVTIPPAPQVFVSGKTTFCQNETTTLIATPAFIAYAWSGPNGYTANSQQPTANTTGVYTVTVTDALGCTDTESIAVTAQPLPLPQIAGPTGICSGQSTTLAVSQNFASYAWAGPGGQTANNQQLTASASGAYTVTVTDASGCTGTDEAVLAVHSNPVPTAIALPYACDNQITLDAGTGFSTYAWAGSNGQTANSQPSTVPGCTPSL